MNWIKRTLRNWILAEDRIIGEDYQCNIPTINTFDSDNGFNLRIFRANGGSVIETSVYDRQKDRRHSGLYVITNDKDLGAELDKIITMETLRA